MSFRQTFPLFTKSKSSNQWLSRQYRDPYVKKRMMDPAAYRSRSAFKLLEINAQMGGFLDHEDVRTVVDLGAAPGGWCQVVAGKIGGTEGTESSLLQGRKKIEKGSLSVVNVQEKEDMFLSIYGQKRSKQKKKSRVQKFVEEELEYYDPLNIDDLAVSSLDGSNVRCKTTIVAVDLLPIFPIPGVHLIRGDFLLDSTTKHIQSLLATNTNPSGKADVILSDMAGNVTGNIAHDTQSSLEICDTVFEFAKWNLRSSRAIGRKKAGVLLVKFFSHPLLDQFRKEKLEPNFHFVHYIKPDSSRAESREGYFLCQGWDP